MTDDTARAELDALWAEMLLDACASDGPIRDNDVRQAIAHYRPKIEAALARARPSGLLREAIENVLCLSDPHDEYEKLVPIKALHALEDALAADEPGLLREAAATMRVPADDIRTALAHLRGPVDRDEAIVMACAQAILWQLDNPAALAATEPPGLDVERASAECSGKPVEEGGFGGCGCLCHAARLATPREGTP